MRHFTIEELCASETARRRGIDNTPGAEERDCMVALVEAVLDPLREAYGKPIAVGSGYRCPRLNEAVGGAAKSQHKKGQAADIVGTPNTREENRRLFSLVKELGLPFDQLINEKNYQWVHVSHRRGGNRGQELHL